MDEMTQLELHLRSVEWGRVPGWLAKWVDTTYVRLMDAPETLLLLDYRQLLRTVEDVAGGNVLLAENELAHHLHRMGQRIESMSY